MRMAMCAVLGLTLAATLSQIQSPAHAQEIGPADLVDTGPVNEGYADAMRGERVETEIIYIGSDVPFSAEATVAEQEVRVEQPSERQDQVQMDRWVWGLIFGVILIAVIVIFAMNAGGIGARFATMDESRRREEDTPRTSPLGVEVDAGPVDQFLARLAAMADRREALILLVSRALEDSAQANELRLGRAQTARDAVRALPQGWRHIAAIRDLVRQVELVHFGGRDISEDRWQECVSAATPILRGVA